MPVQRTAKPRKKAAPSARPRMGRPTAQESQALEERIQAAALDHFLQYGFEAATMDNIASSAGITKRTLYARYTDKETLFLQVFTCALVQWRELSIEIDLPDDATLEEKLVQVGMAILQRELNEKVVKLGRIAALQSERFPHLTPANFSMSWSPRMKMVASILRHHVAGGDIAVDDLELTSELFISLIAGIPTRLAAFGIYRSSELEAARVAVAVKLFLNGVTAPTRRRRGAS